MSTKTTVYPAAGQDLATVETKSNSGETARSFAARHLDQLEAAFRTNPLVVAPTGITRATEHFWTTGGVAQHFKIEHKKGWDAAATMGRDMHVIAKLSLEQPADV